MTIEEFTKEQKDKWNQFVAKNPFGNILQTWEWGEVKSGKTWEVIRLGVFKKKKMIAAIQILSRKLPWHFKLFYSPYGPIIDWEMPYADEILTLIKNHLSEKSDNRLLFWKIEPRVTKEESEKWRTEEILKKIGFQKTDRSIQPQNTTIVDLKRSEKDILSSFEKDTRYSIRRAIREEVEIKEFQNPLNNHPLKEFYDLYKLTAKRGKFPSRTWKQFERAWEEMSPHQMRCFQAWYKNNLLAAAIVFTLKDKAFLIYAASVRNKKFKKKFASYLIQWEIIRSLKKDKVKTYDLWGIAPENVENHPWAGHTLFKKGFRGEDKHYIGAYDLPLSPFYDIFKTVEKIRYKILG